MGTVACVAAILLLEDDPGMARLVDRFLAGRDHTLRIATHAHTALTMALAEPPDVVIVDQHLKDSPTGLWLLAQLREQGVVAGMILLTGDASIPARDSLRSGVVAYLVKPVTQAQVVGAVDAALGWLKLEREPRTTAGPSADRIDRGS